MLLQELRVNKIGEHVNNISDCVKRMFLYFTTSAILAWFCMCIIFIGVYLIATHLNLNELSERFLTKLIYLCQSRFIFSLNPLMPGGNKKVQHI